MELLTETSGTPADRRAELFVSYAIEDAAFVRWLALKLSALGYRVWWDRDRLHGGGAFPTEIDEAIKTKAFRLLAVLSHHSSHKPNPERERSLALALARERKEDFVIPLNLELKTTELPWMLSNLTFVPFMDDWALGLRQLLEDLQHAGAPRFPNESAAMVRANLAQPTFTVDTAEDVWLNLFPIADLPLGISRYEWTKEVADQSLVTWVHQRNDSFSCWAFEPPPQVPRTSAPARDQYALSLDAPWVNGTNVHHVATSLLRQYVERRCRSRGLLEVAATRVFFFPESLHDAPHFSFSLPGGRTTWTRLVGTRRIWHRGQSEQVRYHLAFSFRVELTRLGAPALQIRPTVQFMTLSGEHVDRARNVRRSKAVRRAWFNDKWLARVAAIGSYLAEGAPSWKLGMPLATSISGIPLGLRSSPSLDEAARAAWLQTEDADESDDADLVVEDDGEGADE